MIREMDDGLGDIVRTLQQLQIERQTLVVFLSDNGATGPGSCGGLYGMKGTLWEGGHRVPAVFRWPGKIRAGSTSDALACSIDLMPTVLDLAGIRPPEGHLLDGVSLADQLCEDARPSPRKMFWQYGKAMAMRDGDWKLILNGGKPIADKTGLRPHIHWKAADDGREKVALFHLNDDRSEATNLAERYPERVARMKQTLKVWYDQVQASATPQPTAQPKPAGDRAP